MINLIIRELVSDGTITKQKEATADDPEEKYQATQNLDRICRDFKDTGLLFRFNPATPQHYRSIIVRSIWKRIKIF
jgi:hypothetical protein